jgi:hypothetical protein
MGIFPFIEKAQLIIGQSYCIVAFQRMITELADEFQLFFLLCFYNVLSFSREW